MLKQIIITTSTIFLFSACSLKMPSFDWFSSSSENNAEILKEADKCQDLQNEDSKLGCYKNIENKNSFAQIRLGTYWAEKKDYKQALKYLNLAKENKNLYANLPIAFLYYKGEGVTKDLDKSFELLQESSKVDPVAAFQLSRFYIQGINTKVDYEKGIEALILAGEKDVSTAQEILVTIYKNGQFNQPRDQKKVEYWQNKIKQNVEDKNFKIYRF